MFLFALVSSVQSSDYSQVSPGYSKTLILSANTILMLVHWPKGSVKISIYGSATTYTPDMRYTIFELRDSSVVTIRNDDTEPLTYSTFDLPNKDSKKNGYYMFITNKDDVKFTGSSIYDWTYEGTKRNLYFCLHGKMTFFGTLYHDGWINKPTMYYYAYPDNQEESSMDLSSTTTNFPIAHFPVTIDNDDSLTLTASNFGVTLYEYSKPTIPIMVRYAGFTTYTAGTTGFLSNLAVGEDVNGKFITQGIDSYSNSEEENNQEIIKFDSFEEVKPGHYYRPPIKAI